MRYSSYNASEDLRLHFATNIIDESITRMPLKIFYDALYSKMILSLDDDNNTKLPIESYW